MQSPFKYLFAFTLFLFLLIVPLDVSAQCAMCKEAAETSLKNDPKSMARSLNSGILYLMAVPYLMILFIFRKQIMGFIRTKMRKNNPIDLES